MPAGQTSPAAQFVTEWQAFARGAEWRAFARRAKDSDVRRAWAQWRAFGAKRDRAAPLVATASDEDVASVVSNVGVARIEHALSHATAVELRAHVLAARDSGQKAQAQQASPEVLSAMDADSDAVSRWDVRLAWDAPVRRAVRELLKEGSALGDALRSLSGGDEAVLLECAAIISTEGAAPQVVHSDTISTEDGPQMFTTFVALQDVAPHHGPTRFLPRTHAAFLGTGAHRDFSGDEPRFYERV